VRFEGHVARTGVTLVGESFEIDLECTRTVDGGTPDGGLDLPVDGNRIASAADGCRFAGDAHGGALAMLLTLALLHRRRS
jgi:hypothetical protein